MLRSLPVVSTFLLALLLIINVNAFPSTSNQLESSSIRHPLPPHRSGLKPRQQHSISTIESNVGLSMAEWKTQQYTGLAQDSNEDREKQPQEDIYEFVPSSSLNYSSGQNYYTMTRPEGVRQYYVWVPSSYSSSTPITLVLGLHGLGDDPVNFATATNLTGMAEAEGFILIYPAGSQGLIGTGWNAGTCCVDESVDDLGFLSSVVQLVNASFNIRQDSIHSLGFSNGAFMTESLGCHMSDVFQSIASVSGNTILVWGPEQALAACDAVFTSPASILHIHGTDDIVVPFEGEPFLGWPSIPDDIRAWAKRNDCKSSPVQTFNVSTFNNYVYQNCGANGNIQVELMINEGGFHQWPMIPGVFMTGQYILDFWNRVTPNGI